MLPPSQSPDAWGSGASALIGGWPSLHIAFNGAALDVSTGLDLRGAADELGPLQRQLMWRGQDPCAAAGLLAARAVEAACYNKVRSPACWR